MAQRCTANKKDGTPCRAWAVRGSAPPLCGAHGGGAASPGAPVGNKNAEKHGAYSSSSSGGDLDRRISELNRKIARLSDYIDGHFEQLMTDDKLQGLLDAYGRLVSRVGRLERDRQAVTGDVDALDTDLDEALAVVSEILGLDLTG